MNGPGASDSSVRVAEGSGTLWASPDRGIKPEALSVFRFKSQSPVLTSRSEARETSEPVRARQHPGKRRQFTRQGLWQDTAGTFLSEQKVTLNGSEGLAPECGREERNEFLRRL